MGVADADSKKNTWKEFVFFYGSSWMIEVASNKIKVIHTWTVFLIKYGGDIIAETVNYEASREVRKRKNINRQLNN